MIRRWSALVFAVLTVAACAPRGSTDLSADEREDALATSAHASRTFTYERTLGDPMHRITGEVEDDYRYRATLALGDRELYEEYDVDDRRLLRVRDPSVLPQPARIDPLLAPLLSGEWVADSANAPAEFPKADAPERLVDPGVVLEKVRYMERTLRDQSLLGRLRRAPRHDPGSTRYLRRHDKFPPHVEDGVRYDVFPIQYDGDLLFRDGIAPDVGEALEPYALYTSYWFKDGRVSRIEVFFDVDVDAVTDDMREAVERQAARSGLPVSEISLPPTPQPYRESYTFAYPSEPVRLALPTATATVTLPPLTQFLGGPS